MREISFNYVVVRNGADYGKIWPSENSAPNLRMRKDGDIKTSLSGTFLPIVFDFDDKPTDASVDWLSDQIRPELILDGEVYPLGIYLPASVTENYDRNGTGLVSLGVEAYDRCWQVQTNIPTQVYFESGVKYTSAIVSLLTSAGIALISSTENSATLQEGREDWDLGTDMLTIVNQLLSEINYDSLWFDQKGLAILKPSLTPTAENIQHVIDATDPDVRVIPGLKAQQDIFTAANVFTVICDNPDKSGPMTATSINSNPQSRLSVQRRGRRIMSVSYVDNIANQTELQAYADLLRNHSMITGETITVKTGLLPGYGVGEVTALIYGDRFDICVEKAWSMELRPGGTMTHTLEKVVVNLG